MGSSYKISPHWSWCMGSSYKLSPHSGPGNAHLAIFISKAEKPAKVVKLLFINLGYHEASRLSV
jgi:hypothetical protein